MRTRRSLFSRMKRSSCNASSVPSAPSALPEKVRTVPSSSTFVWQAVTKKKEIQKIPQVHRERLLQGFNAVSEEAMSKRLKEAVGLTMRKMAGCQCSLQSSRARRPRAAISIKARLFASSVRVEAGCTISRVRRALKSVPPTVISGLFLPAQAMRI